MLPLRGQILQPGDNHLHQHLNSRNDRIEQLLRIVPVQIVGSQVYRMLFTTIP